MKLLVDQLIGQLRNCFQGIKDPRNGRNKHYAFDDIAMAAFSAFFMQSPSFLEHQRAFHKAHGNNAGQSLFGLRKLPTDNHIRQQLDRIKTEEVYPGFDFALDTMKQYQALKPFQILDQRSLLALDGSQFHRSYKIQCQQCQHRLRRSGETEYYHSVLCATLVGIGHQHVMPLRPEFITPQDGDQKQDCETKAAYRWLEHNATRYSDLHPIYLGDDLYAKQPMCQRLLAADADFIFRVKQGSHKTLFSYLDGVTWSTKRVLKKTLSRKKPNLVYRYRWTEQLPIKGGDDALKVNYVELRIHRSGQPTKYRTFRFITSLAVNKTNVVTLVAAGRARWKIENEGFNLLKNQGYHMEHNFGHGKQGLSKTLMSLNLIAFAFHAVCDHLCQLWQQTRDHYSRRRRFFLALDFHTEWRHFNNWHQLFSLILDPKLREPP